MAIIRSMYPKKDVEENVILRKLRELDEKRAKRTIAAYKQKLKNEMEIKKKIVHN